jgi:hypothetical protein
VAHDERPRATDTKTVETKLLTIVNEHVDFTSPRAVLKVQFRFIVYSFHRDAHLWFSPPAEPK